MPRLKYFLKHSDTCQKKHFCFILMKNTIAIIITTQIYSTNAELYFNPRFLADDPTAVSDLSQFENGQEALPGKYRVDIILNEKFHSTQDVTFTSTSNNDALIPCLTRHQLISLGVDIDSSSIINSLSAKNCTSIIELFKDATAQFDVGQQKLKITIPQVVLKNSIRGYIPPELWDHGINGAQVNYSFTGNNVQSHHAENRNYAYLNLQSGINIGAWRLRDNTAWSYSTGNGSSTNENKWQQINTWLERDIIPLRSRLTLGDSYTNNDVFNGINFRGIQLASEDNMLADSMKGFAPVIRGIARGTAHVTVKQNGYEIYQETVPPGPFAINDLYAASSGGDLQVIIKETDGSSQIFDVPWSSVPVLQREGRTRFSLTGGKFRSGNSQQTEPIFMQGTVLHGLSDGWTLYGGTQLADRYQAFNLGAGKNMGSLGALSLDLTQAHAKLPDESQRHGQSLRFLYNKSLNNLGTHIQLAGYRYSTSGYFTLSDTAYKKMSDYRVETQDGVIQIKPKFIDYHNFAYNKRDNLQLNLTQQLGKTSTLYLNAHQQTYWNNSQVDKQIQLGLNSIVDDISWTASYSLTKNAWQDKHDQILALNINIPFSHWLRADSKSLWRNANASYSMSHDLNHRITNLVGLYGSLLEDNNLNYSIQNGYTSGDPNNNSNTGYVAMNYRGGYGNGNLGFSRSDGFKQFYYGASGGVLAHANGITFSQPLNSTVVLVKAPGANNVKVENHTGVRTDWRGYAVLPYASEYRENRVALDTNTLADNVDLQDNVVNVIPTRGAIVRAEFKPQIGVKMLMTLTHNNKPIPYGAIVTSIERETSSIVGDGGQVYLSGMPLSGKLQAKWGDKPDANCIAEYYLDDDSQQKMMNSLSAKCL